MTDPGPSYSDDARAEAVERLALALSEVVAKVVEDEDLGGVRLDDDRWGARFAVFYTHSQDEHARIPVEVIVRARQ